MGWNDNVEVDSHIWEMQSISNPFWIQKTKQKQKKIRNENQSLQICSKTEYEISSDGDVGRGGNGKVNTCMIVLNVDEVRERGGWMVNIIYTKDTTLALAMVVADVW